MEPSNIHVTQKRAINIDTKRSIQECEFCGARDNITRWSMTPPPRLSVAYLFLLGLAFIAGIATNKATNVVSDVLFDRLSPSMSIRIGTVEQVFKYNQTLGSAPSQDGTSELAWDDLNPRGQGWIRYPKDAPNKFAISAFHQMHCLYYIRLAYYDGRKHSTQETFKSPHMSHCFEYLRQSIMCSADSNLEPVDPELNSSSPWNVTHQCNDFEQLKIFAEKWRTNNREGFREGVMSH